MRIVAWNVRRGTNPHVIDAVAAMQPDVAVLSECRADRFAELKAKARRAGFDHALERDSAQIGLLVLARAPITRGSVEGAPISGRWIHVVTHAGFDIGAIYGPLPGFDGMGRTRLFWDWLMTVAASWTHRPAAMCGDFNSGDSSVDSENGYVFRGAEGFAGWSELAWRDAFRQCNPDVFEYSWRSHSNNGFRIDHCLLSPAAGTPMAARYVRTLNSWTLGGLEPLAQKAASSLSDHAALIVDLPTELPSRA